jgi:hypothetical protein
MMTAMADLAAARGAHSRNTNDRQERTLGMTESSTTDRSKWAGALEGLTRAHEGDLVAVEVLDRNEMADQMPFGYATYDPRDDAVIVGIVGRSTEPVVLRHMIWHPAQIDVDDMALRVVDTDGMITLVKFTDRAAT